MRQWERFGTLRMTGEWHAHTSYTDGSSTVDEMCHEAERRCVPLIAFTEHVRRSLGYDLGALLDDIEKARSKYRLNILSGCEAKVLPRGELDVDEDVLSRVDYPVFAFHSFPNDKAVFLDSLHEVIRSGRAQTWAHPSTFEAKLGFVLTDAELRAVMSDMAAHKVALELNSKYPAPGKRWIELAMEEGVTLVRGSDAHSVDDLKKRDEKWEAIRLVL